MQTSRMSSFSDSRIEESGDLRPPLASSLSVVEDVIHRFAEAALGRGFRTDPGLSRAVCSGTIRRLAARLVDDADAHEPGPFEEWIRLPHRRERFDPINGAKLAGAANEPRRD